MTDASELPVSTLAAGESALPSAESRLADDPPASWAELLSLVAIVALADAAIYRGDGFAGWAAVTAAAPVLLFLGAARRHPSASVALLGAMLLLVAAKLVWCGSFLAAATGLALISLYALTLAGRSPFLLDAATFTASLLAHGARGLVAYGRSTLQWARRFAPSNVITFALPAAIGIAFSLLFVLANPDVVKSVSETLSHLIEQLRSGLTHISVGESLFILIVGWIAVGLLRPTLAPTDNQVATADSAAQFSGEPTAVAPRPLYLAWRNTLGVVILIYAVYLAFEFHTLWFRVFPKGFYYSGYAHEGAAWLTIGLALATSILSLIFRGRMLHDGRLPRLQRLASIWSIENLLLAASVYNRLLIYVRFNGLTSMRIVGIYGVSAVVAGFLFVLVKIIQRRNFAWLLQRHLWTAGMAVFLYAITPVDAVTTHYNVARILAGDLPPCVQLTEHPLSTEGLLGLAPLLNSSNVIVRDGVAALLDKQRAGLIAQGAETPDWTAYQVADAEFLKSFHTGPMSAIRFSNAVERSAAWDRFRAFAYQWY